MKGRTVGRRRLLLLLAVTVLLGGGLGSVLLFRGPGLAPPPPGPEYLQYYEAGLANLKPGLYPKAIGFLERAVQIDPRQTMGHYNLALAYFNGEEANKALKSINTVLERPEHRRYAEASPTYYDLFVLRGHIYSKLGESEESRANFLKAIELRPGDGEIYHYLAHVQLEMGETEAALEAGMKALELGYVTYKSTETVGWACQKLGRYEEAERHYRESLRFVPGYTRANRHLAEVLRKLGREEEGKRLFDIADKLALADDEMEKFRQQRILEPLSGEKSREELERYALYSFQFGKFPELVDCLSQLLTLDPNHAGYHYQMGVARAQLGEWRLGVEHFRHAIELDGTMVKAMNGLAVALATAGDPEVRRPAEALLWAESAREKGYEGVEVLAEVLHANGKTEEALRLVEGKLANEGPSWQQGLHERQREAFLSTIQEGKVGGLSPEEKP